MTVALSGMAVDLRIPLRLYRYFPGQRELRIRIAGSGCNNAPVISTVPTPSAAGAREAIARLWRADESECLPALIAAARPDEAQRERSALVGRALVEGMRRHDARRGVEALTRAFPLNSAAGQALLSLAEALLRVPDRANADRLLCDRLARVDWAAQRTAGALDGAWSGALRLATALVAGPPIDTGARAPGWRALTIPLVRRAAQLAIRGLSGQFVFGETIEAALARARRAARERYRYSFDMLGEAALSAHDAERYFLAYRHAIQAVGEAYRGRGPVVGGSVSVKLSALHPRYVHTQHGRIMRELSPRLFELARLARRYDIGLVIDAEEADRLTLSLDLIEALASSEELSDWGGFGVAVQAYQKRAPAVVDFLLQLAARRRARLMVRLVKGAYWDAEIKSTQMDGLAGYPVYSRKAYTDVAYLACARRLLAAPAHVLPQFATHNAQTVAAILAIASGAGAEDYEFQCLYGMGAALYRQLLATPAIARPVRIYAPVGTRATLLAYLMRRLIENGAAASFVQRAAAASVSIESLLVEPVDEAARHAATAHPQIPLPRDLYAPERRNSLGVDLADPSARASLLAAIGDSRLRAIAVHPLTAAASESASAPLAQYGTREALRDIRNPADLGERVGSVLDASDRVVDAAIDAAIEGARAWAATEIEARAQILERAAGLYEQRLPDLVALAVRECGKTLANAVGEVREAVDFLRYYAAQIRAQFNQDSHLPLGAVVCISPWNFPLAIFTGQVAAALAAGNTVLAKPAEQSSASAALAVRLLHEAGVPLPVLQLLPGDGERVGARLVADARIGGVVFTGSTAVARSIARTLALRGDVPLIAETGGQNAMIVDSTALPEQVVGDVLRSAFDSAGQRCSALRLLCLQQEIAEPILTMLEGALRELRVGDPADIATDVGPLIDEPARRRVNEHLRAMGARLRCQSPLTAECARGVFVAPSVIEIESVSELSEEVFGPVLHVLRFDRRRLGALVGAINATGYGLTLGIASRIESTIGEIIEHARVGNVYVNRNMIGAVVGVQPFGGQGLSGTGPKAGGPLYLYRLLRQSPGPRWHADQGARVPRPLRQLIAWLRDGDDTLLSAAQRPELLAQAERYADATMLRARITLDGYVGESNELRLQPRGVLRGTARSASALLAQLAAALATGNTLIADEAELAARLRAALPRALHGSLALATPGYEAVLVDAAEARMQPQWLRELCQALAATDGPIVPVVVANEEYALERLLVEQSVSINTAAVGGDTRLLALTED
jgi:RHH-type proline utilization regulon transcriptional repressor/proline dehydrogenase/delta 1-pyrroline-5-carboxylate dehydrogenase